MIPFSYFLSVNSKNDEIVDTFKSAINNSKRLFSDYETFADRRLTEYELNLNEIINDRDLDMQAFTQAGFTPEKAYVQRSNMTETLRLQLLSDNYSTLKSTATEWIDDSNQGASVWNVFLIGNTCEIKTALETWENQLKEYSSKRMSNETRSFAIFSSNGARNAAEGIDRLNESFTNSPMFHWTAIIFGIILYLLFILPYIVQERHAKLIYTLFGQRGTSGTSNDNPYPIFVISSTCKK